MRISTLVTCAIVIGAAVAVTGCGHKLVAHNGDSTVAVYPDEDTFVKLVNLILSDAAKAGASDVHIEPHETLLQVRQRVDGLLHDVLTIPHHLQDATLSRLKIMSGMDIAERDRA